MRFDPQEEVVGSSGYAKRILHQSRIICGMSVKLINCALRPRKEKVLSYGITVIQASKYWAGSRKRPSRIP